MKIVIAVDSFKGSLSSREAAEAIGGALCSCDPTLEIRPFLLADGGEGTVETILSATNGQKKHVTVEGPLGAPVSASYGVIPESGTAVMEMAVSSVKPISSNSLQYLQLPLRQASHTPQVTSLEPVTRLPTQDAKRSFSTASTTPDHS